MSGVWMITVLGWILWGALAMLSLGCLLNGNPDGGARSMMRTQGFILAMGLAATAMLPISKFHLLWVVPIAIAAPVWLMGMRFKRAEKRFTQLMEESNRTGIPIEDLLNREMAKMS